MNISRRDIQLALLRNMLALTGQEQRLEIRRDTSHCFSNNGTLDTSFNMHWPSPSNPGHCHVCCVRGVMTELCV